MPLIDGAYLIGPLIAFAVVGVLAAVLSLALGRDGSTPFAPTAIGRARVAVTRPEDFGLLTVAFHADDLAAASIARQMLASVDIRSTTAVGADGRINVLVFAEELDRARRIVGGANDTTA